MQEHEVSVHLKCYSSAVNKPEVRSFHLSYEVGVINKEPVAIDMWSAGMILLFFLTRKFPLFQSSDDIEALMEIATIIGRKRMEKAATLHSMYLLAEDPTNNLFSNPCKY